MTLNEKFTADLKSIIAECGDEVFTWNGEEYFCKNDSTKDTKNSGLGGYSGEADIILVTPKDAFTDVYPKSKDTLVFRNRLYRIEMVDEEPLAAFYNLICVDTKRGV